MSRNVRWSTRSPGRNVGVARLLHADAAGHLTHDQLDVLVVDRHTLIAIHLLDLFDQVLLGLTDPLDLEELLRVTRGLVVADERVAGADLLALDHGEPAGARDQIGIFGAVVGDHGDRAALAFVLGDAHDARRP